MSFNHYIPTRVLFGSGQIKELHKQKMPGQKALVVISNGNSVKENGSLETLINQLETAKIKHNVFSGIQANPSRQNIMDGAAAAKRESCDFIIALGGGSVLDAAKVIAFMASNTGDVWDYANGGSGKGMPIKNKPLPVIAITTTAGTGSEVDAWGVVSNLESKEKMGLGGIDSLFPVLSIVDPQLMTTVPPKLTAYQGFDALLQCIECYVSKTASLMSDMLAITGIKAISGHLARAVKNGSDLEAREKVAFGNTLSGMAMVVGSTTSEHSLEHAMSAFHPKLPHGAGLIMISKAYFAHFIEKHVCDERFIEIAKAFGVEVANQPRDFITALSKLQEDCGVSGLKMSDYGFTKDEFVPMAINAKETMGGLFQADRIDLSVEDCAKIYEKSFL